MTNKQKEQLDDINTYVVYSTIIVCFSAVIFFVLKSVRDSIDNINTTPLLIDALIVLAIGTLLSLFFVMVKSRSN